MEGGSIDTHADFVRRVQEYMQKALHEAKVNTSWVNPDPAYDEAVKQYVERVLDPVGAEEFFRLFKPFQQRVSHYGLFNSLAQTLLKLTAPGVPDVYQGTELWDFSLVDPDNRRPVDYELRLRYLSELRGRVRESGGNLRALTDELLSTRADGRIKLYLIWRALSCRRDNPGLFTEGDYLPLEADGSKRDHVFAFRRSWQGRHALAVVPRLVTRLATAVDQLPTGRDVWDDTKLLLPPDSPRKWLNVFTGATLTAVGRAEVASLELAEVLESFPVALLVGQG